ncbi:autophagy-related protein 9 [Phragmites australis]|uniref:autophagy-related protein 9 n=1 Tax=Phragmites australis TaxID=29695 RepID=UPI002D76AE68|nr:autophagy-related protein 9 [Phragmites australis]
MALIDLGRGGASGGGRGAGAGAAPAKPRLVMIVADPGRESTAAMEWALSHAVVEGDDILFLHVNMPHPNSGAAGGGAGPSRTGSGGSVGSPLAALLGGGGGGGSGAGADAGDFMEAMRTACKARHPRARVRAVRVEPATEGREAKAQTILAESQRRGVELLVIGHRRVSSFLGFRSANGSSRGHDNTAEFLIEHSKCLCVSVQKKGQNAGYLLNTKTHKNFWLLA